jgi:ribosome-associated protein
MGPAQPVLEVAEPAAPGDVIPAAALVAAQAADDKQGDRTVVLAMSSLLGVTDAFVVTSGRNARHVQAIVDEVEARCKAQSQVAPLRVEGLADQQWVLMDYGDVVVHVFDGPTRALYDLERLWGDAPRVAWEQRRHPPSRSQGH